VEEQSRHALMLVVRSERDPTAMRVSPAGDCGSVRATARHEDASGAILGANRELCDLRAVHGRPAGVTAQTLEPDRLSVDEQVNRQVSSERGDARCDGARFVRVEVRERQRRGLDLRPS
jgi:hypothetical protein